MKKYFVVVLAAVLSIASCMLAYAAAGVSISGTFPDGKVGEKYPDYSKLTLQFLLGLFIHRILSN